MRAAALSLTLLVGCGSCQKGPPAELRVGGETPYVRCLAADPPEERRWSVGALSLSVQGRVLTIDGARRPLTVVAFAGPGPGEIPASAVASVREAEPGLVLVAGDIGDSEGVAEANLAALAGLGVPVLAVAGGRDDATVWQKAFESLPEPARDRVIDVTPLRRVVLGDDELVPVAGAPGGRYGRTDDACGFGEDDLEAVADALEGQGARRWLFAWAGPSGAGLVGLAGADAGDRWLGGLAEGAGLGGGVVAWPRAAAGGEGPYRVVLPLSGPVVETGEGRRLAPAPTVLEVGPEGL